MRSWCSSRYWSKAIRTLRLCIAYDGSGFAGSQVQPGARTVQGELETAWHAATGLSERFVLAGRTDAGVHAEGQVGSVSTAAELPELELLEGLRNRLPPDVRLHCLEAAPEGFNARHDARWREYRYDLAAAGVGRGGRYVDVEQLAAGADVLLGEHDFAAFGSAAELGTRGSVRRLVRFELRDDADNAPQLVVAADAFLRQMVRRLVSALVLAGTGKIGAVEISRALRLRERELLPGPAPASGLTLVRVGYTEYEA